MFSSENDSDSDEKFDVVAWFKEGMAEAKAADPESFKKASEVADKMMTLDKIPKLQQ